VRKSTEKNNFEGQDASVIQAAIAKCGRRPFCLAAGSQTKFIIQQNLGDMN
jgi:hypothetical protein